MERAQRCTLEQETGHVRQLANIVDGAKKQQRAEQNLMTNRGFDLEHGPGFNLLRVFWRSPAVGLKHV